MELQVCSADLVPELEASLTQHGYQVAMPRQHSANGATGMILRNESVAVVIMQPPASHTAMIEIWGDHSEGVQDLLQTLQHDAF